MGERSAGHERGMEGKVGRAAGRVRVPTSKGGGDLCVGFLWGVGGSWVGDISRALQLGGKSGTEKMIPPGARAWEAGEG